MSNLAININKGGRPKKQFDQTLFEELCQIHCTKDEICNVLKVDEKTVTRWCKDTYDLGFSDTYKICSANGKTSLRRAQWKAALNGNTTMLVWLGKNELNQKDTKAVDIESKSNINLNSDYSKLSNEELEKRINELMSVKSYG